MIQIPADRLYNLAQAIFQFGGSSEVEANRVAERLIEPFGGSDSRFTTNPYRTALPARSGAVPIGLDMATSRVAMGQLVLNAMKPCALCAIEYR